jgi:LAO/AO transport system kinase
MTITSDVLEGNRLALARLLTQVENNTDEGREALNILFRHTGQAHLIGVTGAPGTGKSSLVNYLARHYRNPPIKEARKVAVVCVDPSSPFTGGAILGDRVRMRDLAGDPGVFIRSMASRGSLGGLAVNTTGVVQTLDAAGYEIILIETVGAGQAEVDIARLAHTTLVIEAPGLGDDIQAIKAGILEIADILVVNKADLPGVESTKRALHSMLQLAHPVPHIFRNHDVYRSDLSIQDNRENKKDGNDPSHQDVWIPPILLTVATTGAGITELVESIDLHFDSLVKTGELHRRDRTRIQSELDLLLREALISRWRSTISDQQYENTLQRILTREISPYQAIRSLLDGKNRKSH